jgi:glutathione S-transferase
MKLYFSPGACSLSPHIVLREAGLKFTLEKTDTKTKVTASGVDYKTINPRGAVPALQFDDGTVLTEGPAIVQYIADQAPGKNLIPPAGTLQRYRVMEALNFVTSELHKGFTPLFYPTANDDVKAFTRNNLLTKIGMASEFLGKNDYLVGNQFSVADPYMFVVLSWGAYVNVSLADWPNLQAFQARIAARPAVHAAMVAEGLIKE